MFIASFYALPNRLVQVSNSSLSMFSLWCVNNQCFVVHSVQYHNISYTVFLLLLCLIFLTQLLCFSSRYVIQPIHWLLLCSTNSVLLYHIQNFLLVLWHIQLIVTVDTISTFKTLPASLCPYYFVTWFFSVAKIKSQILTTFVNLLNM